MNDIFTAHGFEAYLVGGAVRDSLLKKKAMDWDIATNATPQQVMEIFHKVIPTGIAHGTVTVHFLGHQIETTTYRTDIGYSDGRHPDHVAYAATIEEDLSRRDFTMNAIAVNLTNGALVDPFDGQTDIQNGLIRSVRDPVERFSEDGLRPIRALRFASQLGFKIEQHTFEAISDFRVKNRTAGISMERFRDEFIKILQTAKPSAGLRLMEQTGILHLFIPEFSPCRGCTQGDVRGFHDFDVLDHCLYACDGAPAENLIVRLSALFHDIGKPSVKKSTHLDNKELFTFYNHETVSAELTEKILVRLKFPNSTVSAVTHLVQNHMFHYEPAWTDAAVRRFLVRVKQECLDDLFDLRIADVYGMHNAPVRLHDSEVCRNLCELKDRIAKVTEEAAVLSVKDLAVNGKDLMEAGIPAGKKMGFILHGLLEAVLDDPAQNTKETLIQIAAALYGQLQSEG